MKEIASRVYEWSQYRPERRLEVNGHFVQAAPGEAGVLIDPVSFHPGDEAQVRELGGVAAVLLTGGSAERVAAAAGCRAVFDCRLLVPGSVSSDVLERAGLRELPEMGTFGPETNLPAGLQAIAVPAGAPAGAAPGAAPAGAVPGEVALYHGPSGTAILGESVAGAPAGALSLSAASSSQGGVADGSQPAQIARALRSLLAHWVRRVLVAAGQPVLHEAERAIQDLVFRHDPAAFLLRSEELMWQAPRTMGRRFARRSAECSRMVGLKVLDFEVTAVPSGKQNTLLHRHDGLEEAFIVLQGEGEVQTEQGVFPIRAGDVLAFPPRYQVAHAVRNTGETELRFLAFGAFAEPAEAVALAEYPESNKQFQRVRGKFRRFYLPENLQVDYWEGERLD